MRMLSAALAAAVLLAACGGHPEPELSQNGSAAGTDAADSISEVDVRITDAVYNDVSATLVASGTIAAKQTSNLGALAEGVVEKIFVRVGDRVTKGQPLFQTRQTDYFQRVSEAEAMLDLSRAELDNAARNLARAEALQPSGAVSMTAVENARTAAAVAEAKVRLQSAQLETARQMLSDTTVRAPFDGAITARYIDEGVFMANRFSGMGNSAVVQLQECEIAAAILFAPESELSKVRLGLKGRLFVDGAATPIDSEILILNDRVDPVARTIEFRMAFLNPGCAIKAGQSVRAEVTTDPRSALTLPRSAVHGSGSERLVFIYEDGMAKSTPVVARDINADQVEIVSGLSAGVKVIVSADGPLSDKTPVRVSRS